jgi:ubiquinone/menaquinone biosynthesis C-methylase UbiE
VKAAFDHIAQHYDGDFTNTLVGKSQRKLVWQHLEKLVNSEKNLKILELNCGTGEDAIWLAQKGHDVWATDISEEMIICVNNKANQYDLAGSVNTKASNIQEISEVFKGKEFDLVFSNFGGLNCLLPEEIAHFFQVQLPNLLKPNGRFVGVIMPQFSLFESTYFFLSLQWRKIFRRLSRKGIEAKLNENISVITWYYSTKKVQKYLSNNLQIIHQQPIGFFLPPSYLNSSLEKRLKWFKQMEEWEQWAIDMPFLANFSDHYLIEIIRK